MLYRSNAIASHSTRGFYGPQLWFAYRTPRSSAGANAGSSKTLWKTSNRTNFRATQFPNSLLYAFYVQGYLDICTVWSNWFAVRTIVNPHQLACVSLVSWLSSVVASCIRLLSMLY